MVYNNFLRKLSEGWGYQTENINMVLEIAHWSILTRCTEHYCIYKGVNI